MGRMAPSRRTVQVYGGETRCQVLNELCGAPASGYNGKLSSFESFTVRNKTERAGRNPKTGVEVSITSRKALTFNASPNLRRM